MPNPLFFTFIETCSGMPLYMTGMQRLEGFFVFCFICPSTPTHPQVTTEHRPDMLTEKLRIIAGSQCSFPDISPTDHQPYSLLKGLRQILPVQRCPNSYQWYFRRSALLFRYRRHRSSIQTSKGSLWGSLEGEEG